MSTARRSRPLPATLAIPSLALIVGVLMLAGACSASTTTDEAGAAATTEEPSEAPAEPTPATPDEGDDDPTDDSGDPGDSGDPDEPAPPSGEPEPQPFRPAGPVGSAEAYADLIAELEQEVPAELRGQVPWPDLRNPDPAAAQLSIFDFWIWMAEHHPEPLLVPAIAAENSPSRLDIAGLFGQLKTDGEIHRREQQPYRAWDHRVVTFESAGLPLWLSRDVPDDAVVVYYQDESGPITVRDRETEELIDVGIGVAPRQWLSIMVPTEVGWLLFRDQLIEPFDPELEVPDPETTVPGGDEERTPEV